MGIMGAIAMPLFRYAFPADANDPMWLRGVVSLVFSIIAITTLFPRFFKKFENLILVICVLSVIAWGDIVLYLNSLNYFYFTGVLLISLLVFLFINGRTAFLVTLAGSLLGTYGVAFAVKDPELDPVFVLVMYTTAILMGGAAVFSRVFSVQNWARRNEASNFINYSAVGASRDGILLVGPDGSFIRANQTFLKYMELEKAMIEDNRQSEVMAHVMGLVKDPQRLTELLERPQKEGARESAEEIELKKGLVLEISYVSVFQEEKALGRMWFFRDITRRKRFEEGLIASERRLREQNAHLKKLSAHPSLKSGNMEESFEVITRAIGDFLDVDTISIWAYDMEGEQMVCQKLFLPSENRFEKGQIVFFELYQTYFQAVNEQRILTIHDTEGHPFTAEFRQGKHTGPAGALIHAQIRSGEELIGILSVECRKARAWAIEDQAFVGSMADLVALAIEQDRRRRISEKLETNNNILTATFQLSETGILVVDHNQKPLHFNELYLKIWDVTADYITTAPYEEIIANLLEKVKEARKLNDNSKLLKEKPHLETAGIIEFKDGRVVERYSKSIDLAAGKPGRVWFYLDVTQRTRREQELIERNFELDSFVYRASHDLKAPSIRSWD